jgi:hypothetical protein
MKKYAMLVLASTFMLSVAVFAQEQTPVPAGKSENKEFKQTERPHVSPEKRAERMTKVLGLTDAEKVKVQALFEKQEAVRVQRQAENKKMRAEQMAKLETERRVQDAELEKIIGKDKFQKLESERADLKVKMTARNEKNQFGRRNDFKGMNFTKRPLISAENRADRMAKTLGLTDAEKAKVQALFEKQNAKIEQHMAMVKKVRDEQIAQVKIELKSMNADLENIIGTEKFQQLEKKRSELKEKLKERFGNRQMAFRGKEWQMKAHRPANGPMITSEKRADKMAKEFGLNDSQKSQVQALFEKQTADRHQQIEKVKEEMKAKFEAQRKTNDEALANIIGQENFKKLQAQRADHQDKMKEMRKEQENSSPENNSENK